MAVEFPGCGYGCPGRRSSPVDPWDEDPTPCGGDESPPTCVFAGFTVTLLMDELLTSMAKDILLAAGASVLPISDVMTFIYGKSSAGLCVR